MRVIESLPPVEIGIPPELPVEHLEPNTQVEIGVSFENGEARSGWGPDSLEAFLGFQDFAAFILRDYVNAKAIVTDEHSDFSVSMLVRTGDANPVDTGIKKHIGENPRKFHLDRSVEPNQFLYSYSSLVSTEFALGRFVVLDKTVRLQRGESIRMTRIKNLANVAINSALIAPQAVRKEIVSPTPGTVVRSLKNSTVHRAPIRVFDGTGKDHVTVITTVQDNTRNIH